MTAEICVLVFVSPELFLVAYPLHLKYQPKATASPLTFSRSIAFIAPSMPFTTFAMLPVT